jgi:hypothetical protein
MLPRLFPALALLALTLAPTLAQTKPGDAAKMLPAAVGDFRAQPAPRATPPVLNEDHEGVGDAVTPAVREYASPGGERYSVNAFKTRSASAAYSLLRQWGARTDLPERGTYRTGGDLGVSYLAPDHVMFIKGGTLFIVGLKAGVEGSQEGLLAFAKKFADAVEGELGVVPVLVLHLPEWETKHAQTGAAGVWYAVSLDTLRAMLDDSARSVLEVLSFDGGTEAATATYDGARLVVIEFTTPQHAVEMDAAVNARVAELRAAGRPAPSSYKRVGNYAVFVFGAKDAAAADRLVGAVKYEKDVRWLGRNPHGDEIAQRAYTNTMTSMVVTVFKTSGLAIVLCLGVGAVFGGVIFMRRRARVSAAEAYSDGGEMLRLNLAEDARATHPSIGALGSGKE